MSDHLLTNQDDPEKRIAELERRLAEARAADEPGANRGLATGGRLTPQQVRDVAFAKPPTGKRGYNEDEVDAFLDLVAAALQDPTGRTLTVAQTRDRKLDSVPPSHASLGREMALSCEGRRRRSPL